MAFSPRVKNLESNVYSPTKPASEAAIRQQIDDSIQEVFDNITTPLLSVADGASGMDLVGMTPISIEMTTPQQSLEYLKNRIDGFKPTLNIISVLDYGAIGDGITNDTTAIQDAFDFIGTTGGTVYFPSGDYLIDANRYGVVNKKYGLFVGSNITIALSPNARLLAEPTSETSYTILKIVDATNVKISGGQFVGEKLTHTGISGEWGHGIRIENSSNVIIENTIIYDCFGDGIYIQNQTGYDNVQITNAKIYDCRRHELTIVNGQYINIDKCSFTKSSAVLDGVINVTYGGLNIDLEQNAIDDSTVIDNVTISNSKFNCPTNSCITSAPSAPSSNLRILNNDFVYGLYGVVRIQNDSGSVVENNLMQNSGIYIAIEFENASKFSILNNTLNAGQNGINVSNSNGFKILGNDVRNILTAGIAVFNNSYDGIISHNKCVATGTVGDSTTKTGISVLNSSNVILQNNAISDVTLFGIYLLSSVDVLISGCQIENVYRHNIRVNNCANTVITNNFFVITDTFLDTAVIYFEVNCYDASVLNNKLRNTTTTVISSAVFLTGGSTGVVVTGNDFYKSVTVSAVASSSGKNIVSNNNRIGDGGVKEGLSSTTAARPTSPLLVGDSVFDTTLGKRVDIKTAGLREVATLTITAPCTSNASVTVTLNGVASVIPLTTASNTTDLVASVIRNTAINGWESRGTGSDIIFTSVTVGNKTDATYNPSTTGATGGMVTTIQGTSHVWVDGAGTTV